MAAGGSPGSPEGRAALESLSVRALMDRLDALGISHTGCIEKKDLVDLLVNVAENRPEGAGHSPRDDAGDGEAAASAVRARKAHRKMMQRRRARARRAEANAANSHCAPSPLGTGGGENVDARRFGADLRSFVRRADTATSVLNSRLCAAAEAPERDRPAHLGRAIAACKQQLKSLEGHMNGALRKKAAARNKKPGRKRRHQGRGSHARGKRRRFFQQQKRG